MKKNNRYKAVNDMIVKISSISKWYSYYLNQYHNYDANGQVMATYNITLSTEINKATLDEQHIYGASRLGMKKPNILLYDNAPISYAPSEITQNTLGETYFEISNYLGNVNAVITDRKIWNTTSLDYDAVVMSTADYYPGGMLMPEPRQSGSGSYRFGYNGMEMDDEVTSNTGTSYTTEFRQYDPRLMRWKSLDPLMAQFPWMSPYVAFDNNPIVNIDPSGLEAENWIGKKDGNGKTTYSWDPSVSKSEAEANGWDFKTAGSTITAKRGDNGEIGTVYLGEGKSHYIDGESSKGEVGSLPTKKAELIIQEGNTPHHPLEGVDLSFSGNGLTTTEPELVPFDISKRTSWQKGMYSFCDDMQKGLLIGAFVIATGGVALEAAPLIAASPSLNTAFGVSTKYWWVKGGVSAISQAATNDGNVNVVGVFGDSFLGFGSSSLLQSGVNLKVNVITGEGGFTSLGNGISTSEFMFNSASGFVFGAKGNGLNNLLNKTESSKIINTIISNTIYSLPSNGLNRAYEENGNK
jgi:RHS repeat-associated protein